MQVSIRLAAKLSSQCCSCHSQVIGHAANGDKEHEEDADEGEHGQRLKVAQLAVGQRSIRVEYSIV